MKAFERIKLNRDCPGIQIPSGERVNLHSGMEVVIFQSLGGNFTVRTDHGFMVRIAGKDADALGMEEVADQYTIPTGATDGADLERLVWDQLKTLYDPEIPVNVVDLGLIYACRINSLPSGGNRVEVDMTLTAPGCGMGNVLKAEAEERIRSLPNIKEVEVSLVFDPPWDPNRMTEAAKLELGWM
jgi:probable FeS assembly SUF system protein SufT